MAVPPQALLPQEQAPELALLVPEEVALLVPEEVALLVPEEVPLPPEEAPLVPEEEALALWITAKLAQEAHERHAVVRDVNDAISHCETAIAKLEEAASTLLQETGGAAEENIVAAGDLVNKTFRYPDPDGGPFQAAHRDVMHVILLGHAYYAHREFTDYATALDLIPGDLTWQLWDSSHAMADAQARVSLEWLKAAERETLAAEDAIRLCEGEGERMEAAKLRLQQAISRANEARLALLAMRDTLAELEQIVINGTGQVPPP